MPATTEAKAKTTSGLRGQTSSLDLLSFSPDEGRKISCSLFLLRFKLRESCRCGECVCLFSGGDAAAWLCFLGLFSGKELAFGPPTLNPLTTMTTTAQGFFGRGGRETEKKDKRTTLSLSSPFFFKSSLTCDAFAFAPPSPLPLSDSIYERRASLKIPDFLLRSIFSVIHCMGFGRVQLIGSPGKEGLF